MNQTTITWKKIYKEFQELTEQNKSEKSLTYLQRYYQVKNKSKKIQ